MKIIDPHLHFFDRKKGNYAWLKADQAPFWPDKKRIDSDFSVQDLILQAPFELEGLVHIEAGFDNSQPWREIQWLERSLTDPNQGLRTIAYLDLRLTDAVFSQHLDCLCQQRSVIGFRHIFPDQASQLITCQQVQRNLQKIAQVKKIFECQLQGTDTPTINHLNTLLAPCSPVDISGLRIVINHAASANAQASSEKYSSWYNNMQVLAANQNVYIKASGWEMINRQYQPLDMQRVIDDLLSCFGEDRIMLASNFPLCLLSTSYQNLWQSYADLRLSVIQRSKLMHLNAQRIYDF